MAVINPRYEFRIWSDDLSRIKRALEQLGDSRTPSASDEVYLISRATDDCNAKIRSDTMDIKLLVGEYRHLEQWQPVLKADFPLKSATIVGEIFPLLHLDVPSLMRTEYGVPDFLGEIVHPERKIAVARVAKERSRFELGACVGEFTTVQIEHLKRHTVAVESSDAEAVLAMVTRLEINRSANTSYVREIKRILDIPTVSAARNG